MGRTFNGEVYKLGFQEIKNKKMAEGIKKRLQKEYNYKVRITKSGKYYQVWYR